MTQKEKMDLVRKYEEEYFQKTGEETHFILDDSYKINKFINNYICKYDIILGSNIKQNKREKNDINHFIRYVLWKDFNLVPMRIAEYMKCHDTQVRHSIKVVQEQLDINNEKFVKLITECRNNTVNL